MCGGKSRKNQRENPEKAERAASDGGEADEEAHNEAGDEQQLQP